MIHSRNTGLNFFFKSKKSGTSFIQLIVRNFKSLLEFSKIKSYIILPYLDMLARSFGFFHMFSEYVKN